VTADRPGGAAQHRGLLLTEDAMDLLGRMLQLDPRKRISLSEVLTHRYFARADD
jgi:serine/threonine protein kinase